MDNAFIKQVLSKIEKISQLRGQLQGVMFHSDQNSQYSSKSFRQRL